MLLIIIGTGGCGPAAPCAAPLFLLQMEHSHSSGSSVIFSCLQAFWSDRRSMALNFSTTPVVFRGFASGCVFVCSLTRRLRFWVQSSRLSTFDCLFDSNGRLSVCPFESNGRLSSCRSSASAFCSLDSKNDVLWPQFACSVSSFLTAAVFRS